MAIEDIKKSNSVKTLIDLMKGLPISFGTSVIKIFTIKDHHKRMEYLRKLPEDTLTYLVKTATYILLSSGVVLKESASEMYLTPEIRDFLNKVRSEVNKAGEVTKETVSTAVDVVLGTMSVVIAIGLISLMVPLMLNPAIAAATASASLFFMLFAEMIGFLIPKNDKLSEKRDSKD